MFIHTRSDGSALTRSSRFGIGGTALWVNWRRARPATSNRRLLEQEAQPHPQRLAEQRQAGTTPAA
jgi:hypothetical protein